MATRSRGYGAGPGLFDGFGLTGFDPKPQTLNRGRILKKQGFRLGRGLKNLPSQQQIWPKALENPVYHVPLLPPSIPPH